MSDEDKSENRVDLAEPGTEIGPPESTINRRDLIKTAVVAGGGLALLGSAGTAAARRVIGCDFRRHGFDRETRARQVAEILRGLSVEDLGDPCRLIEQLLRRPLPEGVVRPFLVRHDDVVGESAAHLREVAQRDAIAAGTPAT